MEQNITPPPDRADGILDAALALNAAACETFLIEASGGDSVLLAEVRELLAAHKAMPTVFLARPTADHLVEGERAWFPRTCRGAARSVGPEILAGF